MSAQVFVAYLCPAVPGIPSGSPADPGNIQLVQLGSTARWTSVTQNEESLGDSVQTVNGSKMNKMNETLAMATGCNLKTKHWCCLAVALNFCPWSCEQHPWCLWSDTVLLYYVLLCFAAERLQVFDLQDQTCFQLWETLTNQKVFTVAQF